MYDSPDVVDDVVEERAEFGRGQLGGGVGDRLDRLRSIEIGGDERADVVERRGDVGVLLQQPHPLGFRLTAQPGSWSCDATQASSSRALNGLTR